MSIKSIKNGYEVDCRPQGRQGKRYRKRFSTKSEAREYERWLLATKSNKEWIERPKDKRFLSDVISVWYEHKGQQLKSGKANKQKLLNLARDIGNPRVCNFTKRMFIDYRADRLRKGISPATINKAQMLLSGVFTTLISLEEYHGENPLRTTPRIKHSSSEMGFLSKGEIRELLSILSGDELKITKICLSTGARWGEAANLKGSNVSHGKVTFIDTKNGKNRTVPISKILEREISSGKNDKLFDDCYQQIMKKLKSLDFKLPKGQATHVLRHTFASHFIINGGSILALQKILGHATINQTMVYAHLAPDFLNEAVKYNPLSTT
ncbi:phage integrase [Aliivibrio fischeri]|uniref:Integrase n=1 Tax=Aliivibrio fischeri TaxID=668 RepID=A0A510UEZ9_ALIFS|nr:tyrosine-type recombinase/integrase [Aliivibrio fischeri]GEK13192.1 integrase [Aliivibrio fischeri]